MSPDVVCPQCGRMRPAEAWLPCGNCGATRAQAPAYTPPASPYAPPASPYAPPSAPAPWPTPPPPSSAVPKILLVFLVAFGVCGIGGFCVAMGYGMLEGMKEAAGTAVTTQSTETIESSDRLIAVHPHGSLVTTTTLHEDAQLQLWNPRAELYLLGFSEAKSAFPAGYTLQQYGTVVSEAMPLENRVLGPAVPTTVSGRPALRYRITGRLQGLDIVYWLTVAESEQHFHQLVGWTLAARESLHQATMQRIADEAIVRSTAP